MKKHFFNVIAALSLVCGVFAFSGCTDFENDINEINNRLDKLETGTIASLEEQIATLTASLDEAHGLIDVLQGNVKDLQDADESMKQQIDVLNGEIETVKGQIADLNSQISTLEDELNKKIDEAVKELEAADLANSQRISDLESSLEDLQKELAAAKEELNGVIAELKEAIAAGDDANKALIDELTKKLNDLTQTVSDLSEQVKDNYDKLLAEIEKAVTELEAADAAAAQRIDGILEDIEGINGELTSLKEDLAEQTQKLADLIETVAGLEEAVDILEGLTANLPELEDLVDSIENNYLSKEEAQNTYATLEQVEKLLEQIGEIDGRLDMLEGLNIGERLTDLEANYKDLNDVVIPGLKDDILAAQNAADEAQKAADAAMDFAKDVLGQLETLRNALGIYAEAGALEAKMEALEKMDSTLAAKTEELAGFILDLEESVAGIEETLSTVTNQITELTNRIADLSKEVFEAIDEIKEAMVTKDEFDKFFNDELTKALAEDGLINEAITNAIKKASDELQGNIDSINKRIDEEIMPLIQDLTQDLEDLTDDTNKIVGDLADNIQSLVFVPEYKDDNLATAYFSYVGVPQQNETVYDYGLYDGQKQRVFATFQVTPQNIAESITVDNAALQVMPVKTRNFADGEIEYIKGDDLIITHGPDGRIYVDALVSAEYQDNFAIALYVADENIISEGNFADIDAGEYVTSDYARVALDVNLSNLTDRYVLYNPETDEEYPKDQHLVNGLNEIQKPWTDAPAPVTFFEGYDLALNLGTADAPRYVTLADAEKELRLEEGSLTPNFDAISIARPEIGNGITYVLDEEKGYGFTASMPSTKEEAVKHVGDKLTQQNLFQKNGCNVIDVTTSYEITNKRYTINLATPATIDWTYALAQRYEIITGGTYFENPYTWREIAIDAVDGALGEDGYKNIEEILANPDVVVTIEGTRTVEGEDPEELAGLSTADEYELEANGRLKDPLNNRIDFAIDARAFIVAQVAEVTIDNYHFTKGKETTYNFSKVYTDDVKHVEVVFNFEYTLGAAPEDNNGLEYIDLGNRNIKLQSDGGIFIDLGNEPYEKAYNGDEYFGNLETFVGSLSTEVPGAMYDYAKEAYKVISATEKNDVSTYTYLGILPGKDLYAGDNKNPYIRVSTNDIRKFGDSFEFTTTVSTWYGVNYTFKATGTVTLPDYSLVYNPALVSADGIAYIGGQINPTTGKYTFPTINLSDYVFVDGIDASVKDRVLVRFEPVTKENALTGYVNVPAINETGLSVNNANGDINDVNNFIWGTYTARDYEVNAILYVVVGTGTGASTVRVDFEPLPIKLTTPDPIKLSFDVEDESVVNGFDRKYDGITDFRIKAWQYVDIMALLRGDQDPVNIAEVEKDGERDHEYWNLGGGTGLNDSDRMKAYDAILSFKDCKVNVGSADGETYRGGNWDFTDGIFTLYKENGKLQKDLVVTVTAVIDYQLDYNGVVATDKANGGNDKEVTLVFTINAEM